MTRRHIQLSVDAIRWGAAGLEGRLEEDGRPMSGEVALAYLRELKAAGYEVVPCGCECDEKGRCPGLPSGEADS